MTSYKCRICKKVIIRTKNKGKALRELLKHYKEAHAEKLPAKIRGIIE
jgi:hypothetical protein